MKWTLNSYCIKSQNKILKARALMKINNSNFFELFYYNILLPANCFGGPHFGSVIVYHNKLIEPRSSKRPYHRWRLESSRVADVSTGIVFLQKLKRKSRLRRYQSIYSRLVVQFINGNALLDVTSASASWYL